MAVHAYLKFDNITGECKDTKHEGEVEVLSWHHGFSQPTATVRSTGGGGTVAKADHGDFIFTKYIDSATDDLLKQCWSGQHISTATFTAHRATGDTDTPLEYLKIVMTGVVISGISIGGGGGDLPVENIGLDYATVKYIYKPQKPLEGLDANQQQPVSCNRITGKIE